MKKIFDDRGFLTKEAESSESIKNIKSALSNLLKEDMSVNELQITGSVIQKIIADKISSAIQTKKNNT